MYIQNYQMHNVLNVYSRRLERNQTPPPARTSGRDAQSDRITLSAEAKRQKIMEKVVADIVDKIGRYDYGGEPERSDAGIGSPAREKGAATADANPARFVYNRIDENNRKQSSDLPLENAQVILKRLATPSAVLGSE
jgi:hypothetical protein